MRTIKLVRRGDVKNQRRCEAVVFHNGIVVAEFFRENALHKFDNVLSTYTNAIVFLNSVVNEGYKPFYDSEGLVAISSDRR